MFKKIADFILKKNVKIFPTLQITLIWEKNLLMYVSRRTNGINAVI
jgi:hypothetical protein